MDHLAHIDPESWPGVVRTPAAPFMGRRAAAAHDRLEEFLLSSGIELTAQGAADGDISPEQATEPSEIATVPLHMSVYEGLLINRLVESGFLGLGEGYLAGEWDAEPLAQVIAVLLDHDIESKWARVFSRWDSHPEFGVPRSGEIPLTLGKLCTGGSGTWGSPLFATGTHTTITQPVPWRGHDHLVDVTTIEAPSYPSFADIDQAQKRRVNRMLDACNVGPGSRVLEFPASSGLLAISAARRGATVDVLSSDPDYAESIRQTVRAEKLAGAVHVETISGPVPSPRQWSGEYDAIVSVERMETLGIEGLRPFLRAVDRMLAPGGRSCIQSVVDNGLGENSRAALGLVRGYIWPALEFPTVDDVRQAAMKYTNLVEQEETHLGAHLKAVLPMWRREFAVNRDLAAAAGFDRVYRRLWTYVLALEEALFIRDELDVVQFVFTKPGARVSL